MLQIQIELKMVDLLDSFAIGGLSMNFIKKIALALYLVCFIPSLIHGAAPKPTEDASSLWEYMEGLCDSDPLDMDNYSASQSIYEYADMKSGDIGLIYDHHSPHEPIAAAASKTKFGIAHMQGLRPTMEDAHSIVSGKTYDLYGLFDGHGGDAVANHVATELHQNIVASKNFDSNYPQAILEGFDTTERSIQKNSLFSAWRTGSTAIVALVTEKEINIANLGDCRAVLCQNSLAIPLSTDHKPDLPSERTRIEILGGNIIKTRAWRVYNASGEGGLAISRSFGDFYLKNKALLVSPVPEITVYTRQPGDEFLILACDGVWDVLSNSEAVTKVKTAMSAKPGDLDYAAQQLTLFALDKGSTDNVSAIIISLN